MESNRIAALLNYLGGFIGSVQTALLKYVATKGYKQSELS